MENFIDIFGVRITPKVINFSNCELNETYVRVINVQNINAKSLTVRFYPPQSKSFSLICKSNEKVISAGLSHICSLKFTMDIERKTVDRLVVTVDGQVHEVPIFVYSSAPDLAIVEQVNFGTLVMANKVVSQQIKIVNEGSRVGEFKLIYNGNKPLNIVPNEGFVSPYSSLSVQVEYVTRETQTIDEICQVHFDGKEPFTIRIRGEVVRRSLELLDTIDEGQQIHCIKFPDTYYGSDKSKVALLFNNSPEKIQFIVILEEDAVGQESGSHIALTAGGINPKECTNPLTSLITMYPNQGSLGPYEKIPVLFRFSPRWKLPRQAFKKTLEPPLQQTFAVFLKIQIVGCGVDTDAKDDSSAKKDDLLTKSQQLEVAVTGTAAPILLDLKPEFIDFGRCIENETKTEKVTIFNRSLLSPCVIELPREAHFNIEPRNFKIPPNESVDLTIEFNPKQYGLFNIHQTIKVLAYVKDSKNPFYELQQAIYEQYFIISGECVSTTKSKEPIYYPGITPLVSNSVGLCAETKFSDLGANLVSGPVMAYITPNAVASGGIVGSTLYRCTDATKHPFNNRTACIAFPNDLATSIRPSERHKEFRTIMKRFKRHTYIDPDYEYTDDEIRQIRLHEDGYLSLIRKSQMLRKISKLNAKFESFEDQLNLGIIPGNGILSPKLTIDEIKRPKSDGTQQEKNKFQLLSSKDLKQSDKVIDIEKAETFHAVPTTNDEKYQCSLNLSPQELHQIVIGPSTINFGDVCIRSSSSKDLNLINNLHQSIHVCVIIDCKELRQSSPLSQVIPPKTKTIFPLVFESGKKGKFQRNLNYVINGYYQNHVIVLANVVLNQLELSTDNIFLYSLPVQPPDSGIRSTITLSNPLNSSTEFLWEPVFNFSGGIAFSIRPKEGVVESHCQLDCEVVFHPSFMAPAEGDFVLRIPGNEESNLDVITQDTMQTDSSIATPGSKTPVSVHCVAILGSPHVTFQSRRVMFGNIPINLTTTRTAILINTGSHHAFYRVVADSIYEQFPGLIISPLKGSVPVGGQTELTIKYHPKSLTKFDCSIPIVIRGWKEIELKLSGTVIIPQIEIPQKRIEFGGVAVGSEKIVYFDLVNKSPCRAQVEFDFLKYKDFAVYPKNSDQNEKNDLNLYIFSLKPLETIDCQLVFTPTEVASYDFPLAISINQVDMALQSAGRTLTNNSSLALKDSVKLVGSSPSERSVSTDNKTQPPVASSLIRHVTATATRQPISVSDTVFTFHYFSKAESEASVRRMIIYNTMEKPVDVTMKLSSSLWKYGYDKENLKKVPKSKQGSFYLLSDDNERKFSQDFTFSLSALGEVMEIEIHFEPEMPGLYVGEFPVYIGSDSENIYRKIYLFGFLESPMLVSLPDHLFFLPAPLNTELSIAFKVVAVNFDSASVLNIRLPIIQNPENGEDFQPFKVNFLTSKDINPMSSESKGTEIWVKIMFYSSIPINIRSNIELVTDSGVSKLVGISASADNCILSWNSFFNKHQTDFHIVCQEGKPLEGTEKVINCINLEFGEAQLKPIIKDSNFSKYNSDGHSLHSRNSTTATSSNFEESSITYEETITDTESAYLDTPIPLREGALNNVADRNRNKKSYTFSGKANNQNIESIEGSSSTFEAGSTVPSEKDIIALLGTNEATITIQNQDEASSSNDSSFNMDFDLPTTCDTDLLLVIQRWFTMHGWPGSLHPINIPYSLRTSLQRRFGRSQTSTKDKSTKDLENMENTGLKSDSRDLYDMILFLSGRQILGINTTVALPTDLTEKSCHIYLQHATLIGFIQSQGGQLAQILPEYLMDYSEYESWHLTGCPGLPNKDAKPHRYDAASFEKISKKAWTVVLLQLIKVFTLVKVTYKAYRHALQILHSSEMIPEVHMVPTSSNCYSINERILLAWLNYIYNVFRSKVWPSDLVDERGIKRSSPPARWIINFDNDFMDSLILATAIGAYVPFLIQSHFRFMYSKPQNPEQYLHNALKVVNALKEIGFEFDIQAIDIVDPNPIMMLLLTLQLFQTMPLYAPKSDVIFTGSLHEQVTKYIQLSNPTSKPLIYECIIIGNDSSDFSSPKGNIVNLSPKASIKWPISFKSRFLRPAEALIMFVGRKSGSVTPANLIFNAKSKIQSNSPSKIEKVTEKCYTLKTIDLKIVSPYNKAGEFKVQLIENSDNQNKPSKEPEVETKPSIQNSMKPLANKKGQDSVKTINKLRAFFCHTESISIDDNKCGILQLFYLPFHLGKKSCSVIFSNDLIGEFVYCIEAIAEVPDPIPVSPSTKSKTTVRLTSAEASSRGLEGNDKIIYWKCEVGSTVHEIISVPINNTYKENALLIAAQHHLSAQEVSRRQVTGTLNSSSLLLTAVQLLTFENTETETQQTSKINKKALDTKYSSKGNLIDFEVEFDSSFFNGPSKIQVPDFLTSSAAESVKDGRKLEIKTVDIPIKFYAPTSGIYPCNVILKGPDDVRVYKIECTVTPEGHSAQLYFRTPLQDSIVQNIPIVNKTKQDWPLRATITGTSTSFTGPETIMAKALSVSQFPLQFKPTKEGKVNAKLCFINEADGTEHIYDLFGEGESPLALDTLYFECSVGETLIKTLQIPNSTRRKHLFFVESDLDWMVLGGESVSVLPNRSSPYEFSIKPNRSGKFKGILAFVSGKKKIQEYDSDGEEVTEIFPEESNGDSSSENTSFYRIWYSLIVDVNPGPPQDTFDIQCPCLESAIIEIPVTNPVAHKDIVLLVEINGPNLIGKNSIVIPKGGSETYSLKFLPSGIGNFDGKIKYFEEEVGEFWFKLNLKATNPLDHDVPLINCEIGKCTFTQLLIKNLDKYRPLMFFPDISNTDCFSIDLINIDWFDSSRQCLVLAPQTEKYLSVKFVPFKIGISDHECDIILKSDLLGDWKFNLKGCGLLPKPSEISEIKCDAGSNKTILISFLNPFLETVLVDISINEEHESVLNRYLVGTDDIEKDNSSGIFKLLLKNHRKLKLESKQSIDIPISFAPIEMRSYNAICSLTLRRRNGLIIISDEDFENLVVPNVEVPSVYDKYSLRWLFPIKGIPEVQTSFSALNTPLVQGPLRVESKERLELTLWGLPPPVQCKDFTSKTVKSAPVKIFENDTVLPANPMIQNYIVDLEVLEIDIGENINTETLNEYAKVNLLRQSTQVETGSIVLVYEIRFKPLKMFRLVAQLVITSRSGAVWKFPIRFVAHECDPDDEIVLEAVGINKPVGVRFYLTSKTFEPTPFKAYFLKGGDPDFSVNPESGSLPPLQPQISFENIGLAFTVSWTPKSYGRSKGARLVIETPDIQWVYKFVGVSPNYVVPLSNSMVQSSWGEDEEKLKFKKLSKQKNFIRQNIDLLSTGVSSPIKGAPLFPKIS